MFLTKTFAIKNLIAICLIIILFASCESYNEPADVIRSVNLDSLLQKNSLKVSLTIGIAGTLLKKEGNCMPMSGGSTSCRTYPVSRTILIYNYININEAEGWGPLFTSVNSRLIAHSNADPGGFFQVKVDPGTYSVFIRENDKFYANSFDGQGGINPITVKVDSVSIIRLNLDYAVY